MGQGPIVPPQSLLQATGGLWPDQLLAFSTSPSKEHVGSSAVALNGKQEVGSVWSPLHPFFATHCRGTQGGAFFSSFLSPTPCAQRKHFSLHSSHNSSLHTQTCCGHAESPAVRKSGALPGNRLYRMALLQWQSSFDRQEHWGVGGGRTDPIHSPLTACCSLLELSKIII